MKVFRYPKKEEWSYLLRRPEIDHFSLTYTVQGIIAEVKKDGDKALQKLTLKYDNIRLDSLAVSSDEIAAAKSEIDKDLIEAIDEAYKNIEKFHKAQISEIPVVETTPGVFCWQRIVPIEKVGLYIPGGSAPLQ